MFEINEDISQTLVYLPYRECYSIISSNFSINFINNFIEILYTYHIILEKQYNMVINIINFSAQQLNLVHTLIVIFILFMFSYKNYTKFVYSPWYKVWWTDFFVSWFTNIISFWYSFLYNIFDTYFGIYWFPVTSTVRTYFPLLFYYTMVIFFSNFFGLVPFLYTNTSYLISNFSILSILVSILFFHSVTIHGRKFMIIFRQRTFWLMHYVMMFLEIMSFTIKLFILALRLFINMLAGHLMMKVFMSGFFVIGEMLLSGVLSRFVLLLLITFILYGIFALEVIFAFLQMYVFLLLYVFYIRDCIWIQLNPVKMEDVSNFKPIKVFSYNVLNLFKKMLQQQSYLTVLDNSGIKKVKCIKITNGFFNKNGSIKDKIRFSLKKFKSNKGYKKGQMGFGVITHTQKNTRRIDGFYLRFNKSVIVPFNHKKNTPIGKKFYGPFIFEMFSSRFFTMSRKII